MGVDSLEDEHMEQTDFIHVDADSQKLSTDQKLIGWTWSKMGVASLVTVI